MAKAKTKAKAISRVPQSREDAVWAIGRIGTLRREIEAHKSVADEQVREAGETLEAATAPLADELSQHQEGVQVYCEANRLTLTNEGKIKYHDFGTGRINWRMRPPKVSLRGADMIIEACRKLGLTQFLRVKEDINKDAMLADPDKARLIAGVTISSEGEEFIIEPTELETAQPLKA